MVKQRILIVSGAFYPEISPRAYRTTELSVELSRRGHEVTVFVPFNGYNFTSFSNEHNLLVKNIGNLRWKEIALEGGKVELIIRRIVRRGLKMLFEWPDIELTFKIAKAIRFENDYDMLISIAVPYPVHWGVAKALGKNNKITKCWVADCGDPYMGDKADSFRKLFYFKYIEKWFCCKADYITIPFEGARSAYYPEFHDKIKIIPQGFNLEHLERLEYKKQAPYQVFAYAGGFIPGKRDPGKMLEFLIRCQKEFKFIVYTSQPYMLLPYKDTLKDKLEIRNYIPREELLPILAGMDFLVNFDNNIDTQLPSKLIEYAITGRPVINIKSDSDFSDLVEFLDGNYQSKISLPPVSTFNIINIANKFLSLLPEA